MSETIVVTTTFEQKNEALKLAEILLEKRLVACARIEGPVESLYWWKGKIEYASEYKLVMKSSVSLWGKLEKTIRLKHPYDVPEIVAVSVEYVSKDYDKWLHEELKYG